MSFDEEQRPKCEGCGMEIDPTVCHCGDTIENGKPHDNHMPVPMGCACHLSRATRSICDIKTGDNGQRYEVSALNAAGVRFVVGWANKPGVLVEMVEKHPVWNSPLIIDRGGKDD